MRPIQKTDGGPLFSAREYDIAANTAISRGQVVKLSGGLVVKASAGETGQILGVAAESHSGVQDELDKRSNGTKIMIWDDPQMIYECPAPVFEATGGTATTVTASALGAFANNDFTGGYLVLVEKAEGSANTDPVGVAKQITGFAYSSGTSTFTVASGGTAAAGDKYMLFPPAGFKKGNFDTAISKLVVTATASLSMKVIGRDIDRGTVRMMPVTAALGTEE